MKHILFRLRFTLICCFLFTANVSAQKTDSIHSCTPLRFQAEQLIVPSGLMLTGVAFNGSGQRSIKNRIVEKRNEIIPQFRTRLDDYLQFSPIVLTYGFEAFGMKPKTDIANRSVILLKSEVFLFAWVHLLKNTTKILRPDRSAYNSFPSGHTTQAFAAATLLSEEYGYRYKWVPYLSYSLAAGVGVLRMANNKHYISDVLVGAGIGILSTKIVYWTHGYKWGKRKKEWNY